jgi:micrococcal nuclease
MPRSLPTAGRLTADVPYQLRLAKSARAKAKKFCPEGSLVVLKTQKERRDRYARYLAEVIHEGKNLSDYLLEIGAARPWN